MRAGRDKFLANGPRWGVCCQFAKQPIPFRTTTAAALSRMPLAERQRKLANLCLSNAESLLQALQFCDESGIGCFRIASSILPIKTHPEVGYDVEDLPNAEQIVAAFRRCGAYTAERGIRTVFHPDQFVVLSSPREDVVKRSIQDIEYQAEVAEWVGADVINIHGGGAYGDKPAALATFARSVDRLSHSARSRLTIENDDKVFTPVDLLPLCRSIGASLVYDVHHHRCLPDGWTFAEATTAVISTWNREPLFHISSPLAGWQGSKPERHHDFIDIDDFPDVWAGLSVTVEVEAKAKELAVLRLREQFSQRFKARTPVTRARTVGRNKSPSGVYTSYLKRT